jgi:hypothetical protein
MALDLVVRAGTNIPIAFVMPADFSMDGYSFELVVAWLNVRRVYTQSNGLSVTSRTVTWTYTLADSRLFPLGRLATLELQWSSGGIQDSDTGMLTVQPGISND